MEQKLVVFNHIPSVKDVIKVRLPYGAGNKELEFAQGDQLVAETLVLGTEDEYVGELVTADTQEPVIIFNQNVYKDEFGNRHGYVANPSYIRYKSGEIVTCVRPSKNIKLQLTEDTIDGTPEVGKFLVPQVATEGTVDTYRLVVSDDMTGKGVGYKIEDVNITIEIGTGKFVKAPRVRTM